MQYLLWYVIIFMVILLVLYIVEFHIPNAKEMLGCSKVFRFITKKYDLSMNKSRVRVLSKVIVVANAFILSIPMMLVLFVKLSYFEAIGISLVIFIALILGIYNLIGYMLKKKGW